MAILRHRKLFPASSDTNKTIDCADSTCEPACPYDGCYLYPDYTVTVPPPPPPASTKQGHHVSPYVIIIVAVVGSVVLLLSYYAFMVKYCSRLRRSAAQSDGPGEEFLDHNHGPVIDHPIWYINTVGLQPSVINSITMVKYSKGDGLIEGTDCSVCLNEFREDESLRLLPKCNHAFHIPCIDTWLRSHVNCPLCRAGILSNTCNVVVASNDLNSRNSGLNENTQMENLESGGQLEGNQVGEIGNSENRTETGEVTDFAFVQDEGKEIENSEKRTDAVSVQELIQPMRRSVSMDGAAEIALTVREICSTQCEESLVNLTIAAEALDATNGQVGNSRVIRTMGSSSIAYSLHRGPDSMKRSFSYGGRY